MDVNDSKNNTYNNIDANNIVSIVDDLLENAIKYGASDIHFEPTESSLAVKYRLDGVLNTIENIPKSLSDNVIARLKVLGGLLTYRNDIPQEGRIEIGKSQNRQVTDKRLAIWVLPSRYMQISSRLRQKIWEFYYSPALPEAAKVQH